jgi:hypothetical protein
MIKARLALLATVYATLGFASEVAIAQEAPGEAARRAQEAQRERDSRQQESERRAAEMKAAERRADPHTFYAKPQAVATTAELRRSIEAARPQTPVTGGVDVSRGTSLPSPAVPKKPSAPTGRARGKGPGGR